jgi:Flp pilus assembly protein TadD
LPIRLALSVAVAGAALVFPHAQPHASQGHVAEGPLAVEIPSVERRVLGSLAGAYLAARHASLNKDLSSAAGFYARALEKDPENPELLDRSVVLNVASGNVGRAAELARELLAIQPRDQVALVTLSVAQLRKGDTEAAKATLDELAALGRPLQELVAGLLQAWAMALEGDSAQAISMLDDLEGPSWYETFTKRHAGLIADQAELYHIARDRLALAYERDPAALRVVDAYARALARSGDVERASAVVDRFETMIGGNASFTRALRDEIESGDVSPQVATARAGAGEVLYDIGSAVGTDGGNDTFAASLLQLSLYLAPDAYFPAMALGNVLEAMRQHEEAIEVYRAIDNNAPLLRDARVQEALNLNILDRHDEAIAILSDLVEENPRDVGTAIALGNVYRSQKMFEEAGEVYASTIDALDEVPPAYWTLYYYRGIAYERTDRWSEAESDFRKALEMEPEQPLVLNYLGYSWIDRGENLDEALDMVQRAVAARPDDGYIVDSLGWAYYRLGRFEEAVEELERAVTLKPLDPVINDHLGDAYWRVGRKLEATFQWSHALDNEPEPELAAVIKDKLERGLDAVEQDAAVAESAAADEPETR